MSPSPTSDLAPANEQVSAPAVPVPEPPAAEHQPEGRFDLAERVANAVVLGAPALLLAVAVRLSWQRQLHWQDLLVLTLCYIPTGLGITVGFHRLFTHRAFKAGAATRAVLAALGSAAVEGPVIEWVANHRKHHAFSDQDGDPHSPHVGHGDGWLGALRGLMHAHVGWLFRSDFANEERYARDLLADPAVRFVDRTFVLWVFVGLAVPFGLGYALTGRLSGALTGLLWGGAVRIFLLHHVTFSINSLCHYYGRRRFDTGDESRNLAWLAPLSMGEAWHNNHHAFPTSAAHGLRWWEFDPSKLVIRALAAAGLAWDVVQISPERQGRKLLAPEAPGERAPR
jgi:stearoyl-CoA desaturase (Delta-9 desaturase)